MEKDDTNFTNLHEFANQAAQISRKGRQGRKEDKNTRTLNFAVGSFEHQVEVIPH